MHRLGLGMKDRLPVLGMQLVELSLLAQSRHVSRARQCKCASLGIFQDDLRYRRYMDVASPTTRYDYAFCDALSVLWPASSSVRRLCLGVCLMSIASLA